MVKRFTHYQACWSVMRYWSWSALHHNHLKPAAHLIPELESVPIKLGRDVITFMNFTKTSQMFQRLNNVIWVLWGVFIGRWLWVWLHQRCRAGSSNHFWTSVLPARVRKSHNIKPILSLCDCNCHVYSVSHFLHEPMVKEHSSPEP